jgi:hypothetical protein
MHRVHRWIANARAEKHSRRSVAVQTTAAPSWYIDDLLTLAALLPTYDPLLHPAATTIRIVYTATPGTDPRTAPISLHW